MPHVQTIATISATSGRTNDPWRGISASTTATAAKIIVVGRGVDAATAIIACGARAASGSAGATTTATTGCATCTIGGSSVAARTAPATDGVQAVEGTCTSAIARRCRCRSPVPDDYGVGTGRSHGHGGIEAHFTSTAAACTVTVATTGSATPDQQDIDFLYPCRSNKVSSRRKAVDDIVFADCRSNITHDDNTGPAFTTEESVGGAPTTTTTTAGIGCASAGCSSAYTA
jgi:hypothetical protein